MTPQELKQWRARLGLSQPSLAAKLGVHWVTVAQWEQGRRVPPAFLRLALQQVERDMQGAGR